MEGRYSNGSNFDVYLKGHAGEPFRVDRRNGASFNVPKATLTLVVTMQRAVIRSFGEKSAELRGRGLLGRFLYSLPPSTLGTRNPNPTPLSESVEKTYATAIRELLALRPGVDPGGSQVPYLLKLSPEARACWIAFTTALEPRLGPTGDLHVISDWASKLTGASIRLAGVLHCAREHHQPWASPIERSSMESAVAIVNYLIDHARAAFRLMTLDRVVVDAEYQLHHIRRRKLLTFTKRDLFQWTKGHFERVRNLEDGLATLIEHNYIRELDGPELKGRGRPGSSRYAVNPELYSQNPHNPDQGMNSEDSEDPGRQASVRKSPVKFFVATTASCRTDEPAQMRNHPLVGQTPDKSLAACSEVEAVQQQRADDDQ